MNTTLSIHRIGVFGITAALCLVSISTVYATGSSTNYDIKRDTANSGGGDASSSSYQLKSSVGQGSGIGESSATNSNVKSGVLYALNASSAEDLNNDGVVNSLDIGIMMSNWGSASLPPSDLNKDNNVNSTDLEILLVAMTP